MSLCEDNKKLLKGFNKKRNIDGSISNITLIFQKIIEAEPEEKRERKIRNMLYDAKASEYEPSGELLLTLSIAMIIGATSILGSVGSEYQSIGLAVIMLLGGIVFWLGCGWEIKKKKDYKRYVLILFLEEQLELYGK